MISPTTESLILQLAPPHIAVPNAPGTLEELRSMIRDPLGGALQVSSLYSDRTIYSSPAINHAFRAWHDMLHYTHGLKMNYKDEQKLARVHYVILDDLYVPYEDLCCIHADTYGQTEYCKLHGTFPNDQRGFVTAWRDNGAHFALFTWKDS